MTYGDINSGATPQPGGVVFASVDSEENAMEQVARATQQALDGEGPFANVEAGIAGNDEPATTAPAVEADDQAASGKSDVEDNADLGYIPVVEADDQAASAGTVAGSDDEEPDEPDADEDDADEEPVEPDADDEEAEEEDEGPPAKSANKPEWVDYAVSKGADREEADDKTKDELIEEYGD